MGLLEGKTALITGGSRGIGKAIAMKFAQEGAQVAITASSYHETAQETEKEILKEGVKAAAYGSDARDFNSAKATVEQIHDDFGRIDILINNAGVTRDTLLMRMSEEDWDEVIASNMKSVFNYTKAIQQLMLRQRAGCIINLSSVVGLMGNAGQSNYAASKAGIVGFTKSIAKELGSRSIRVNAIAPGFVRTDMTANLPEDRVKEYENSIPLKRMGNPDDIANAAIFLASDMASYITGQVLQVDGGMYI